MRRATMAACAALITSAFAASGVGLAHESEAQSERQRAVRAAPAETAPADEPQARAAAVRSSETQAALRSNVRGLTIDAAALEKHEMRPANVVGVESSQGRDEADADAPVRALITLSSQRLSGAQAAAIQSEIAAMPQAPGAASPAAPSIAAQPGAVRRATPAAPGASGQLAAPPKPQLDVNKFGQAFHAGIKDNVAGYALRIARNGQVIYTLQWNWAQTPSDSSLGWNTDRRMHVASVSKLITAMAMTRLLHEKKISYDAKIIDYLPAYWQKGSNIDDITFRHLLTHTSGFSTGGSSSDFQFMKSRVANGVSGVGGYDYENMNFGLCRILIAVINGNISRNTQFPLLVNDQIWDAVTIAAYAQYVNQKVFAPAGVNGPTLDKPASPARAYTFPVSGGGWNSGNLASMTGGAAWHMSINEVLRVMHAYRRGGQILPPSKAQEALDSGLGIDRIIDTSAGKLYDKNGRWRDGSQRTEQSVAVFMPDGLDIVVFVNSPIGANAASLRSLVSNLYIANIVEP